jgi:hypothetical protein
MPLGMLRQRLRGSLRGGALRGISCAFLVIIPQSTELKLLERLIGLMCFEVCVHAQVLWPEYTDRRPPRYARLCLLDHEERFYEQVSRADPPI